MHEQCKALKQGVFMAMSVGASKNNIPVGCADVNMPRAQAKQDSADLQERSKALKQDIATAEVDSERLERERDVSLASIGNFVHDSVPVSADEASAACDHWLCRLFL